MNDKAISATQTLIRQMLENRLDKGRAIKVYGRLCDAYHNGQATVPDQLFDRFQSAATHGDGHEGKVKPKIISFN